jgi:hypothetical protein
LYSSTSEHIATDPVFGVKTSLIKDFEWHEELPEAAKHYDLQQSLGRMKQGKGLWVLEYDFVLLRK